VTAVVPERPLLKPWYRLAAEDDRIVLEYAQAAVVFDGAAAGRLLPALLPLLDGEHSIGEIVAILGEPAAPAIEQALKLLADHRLLTSPLPTAADDTLRFLFATDRRGADPADLVASLDQARVAVAGSAGVGEELARVLRCSGIRGIERGSLSNGPSGTAELVVVAPGVAELRELEAWNRHCLSQGTTWLALLPCDGRVAPVGPLFVPGETACYDCFRIRRASTCGYAEEFWSLEGSAVEAPDALPLRRAVAGVAGWLVLRWLAGRDASLPGIVHALEIGSSLTLAQHHVWRVPRCPSCSEASGAAPPAPWFDGALR
jgi:bacteriocin biosynthesis cyclodehydratase domain-containing protein